MTVAVKGPAPCVNEAFLSLEQGWEPGWCPWPLLVKEMKSSAPPLRQGLPHRNTFLDGRGLGPGLSVKDAEVFLLLPPGLGFRVVEAPMFPRRHQGTISKMMWVSPMQEVGAALKPHGDLGLLRHQGGAE